MRRDDEDAFRDFFRAEHQRLVNRLALVTGNRAAAEDAAQDAFVKLYRKWPAVRRYQNPQAWLRTVGVRIAVRATKKLSKAAALSPPAVAGDVDDPVDVRSAISKLTPQQRAAVVLHYIEDMAVKDIAEAIGCSPSTVKVHLHRARHALAQLLKEDSV